MKKRYKISLGLLLCIAGLFAYLSLETFTPPTADEIDKRLNYLERVIYETLTSSAEVMRLKSENPEFMLFTYAYSSYAVTNLATQDSSYVERAIPLIRESITKVLEEQVWSVYGIDSVEHLSDASREVSVLYLGHLNLMLGCYRLLSNDDRYNDLNNQISASLAERYRACPFLNLESYPSQIWIPDNTVAIASLKLHAHNAHSDYGTLCEQWVEYARNNYLEQYTGVLYSTIDASTGKAREEPRGSMLGWSIMFIYQFDAEFAMELYDNYKSYFSTNYGVLRLFRERYDSSVTAMADIDSGPIVMGYSIPANEFALGCAITAKDYGTAKKIERLIGIGAETIEENNELRYKVRFVDMNISPMAEALVLNSLTLYKWVD